MLIVKNLKNLECLENAKIANLENLSQNPLSVKVNKFVYLVMNVGVSINQYLLFSLLNLIKIHVLNAKYLFSINQLKTFNLTTKTKDKEETKYNSVCLMCHEELNKKLLYAPYLGEKKFMI